VDGVLVPPRDPARMAGLIGDLLADYDRRQSLGTTTAKAVRASFGLKNSWQDVTRLLNVAGHD
jgi:hypothetical protein